jgi:phosphoglycolate phosphatase
VNIVTLPSLVVFDMAGTTIQDDGQVPAAFTVALAAHGISATPEQINRVRGASKRQAVLRFVPEGPRQADEAAAIYARFREELAHRYTADGVRAMVGAAEVFRDLRHRGIKVALTTGFDRETTVLLLSSLQWLEDTVDSIVCGDDVAQGRPAPDLIYRAMADTGIADATRVAAVGDTTLDLDAGARAGVGWNIGVLSGAHRRDALERAPHTHIVDSVAALLVRPLWGP